MQQSMICIIYGCFFCRLTHKNNQCCVFVHLDFSSRIFFVVLLKKNFCLFYFEQNEAIIFFFCLPIQQRTKNWKNKKIDVYREKQDYFLFSKRNTVLEIASKFKFLNWSVIKLFLYFDWEETNIIFIWLKIKNKTESLRLIL